jgi:hypothetical protein
MGSKKLIFGVGRVGVGRYKSNDRRQPIKIYGIWYQMIGRCYMELAKRSNRNRTYMDCVVCDEWLDFQVFAEWYEENHIQGFHLEKDIISPGNKVYGPEFCGFVPPEINTCLTHTGRINRSYDLPTGVSFCPATGDYQVTISEQGRSIGLGRFSDIDAARSCYLSRKKSWLVSLANKYKEQLTERMYNAILVFPVEMEK